MANMVRYTAGKDEAMYRDRNDNPDKTRTGLCGLERQTTRSTGTIGPPPTPPVIPAAPSRPRLAFVFLGDACYPCITLISGIG